MNRRGILGMILSGIMTPFVTPMAVAAEFVATKEMEQVVDQAIEDSFAYKPESPWPFQRGQTRVIVHIDELGWVEQPYIQSTSQ